MKTAGKSRASRGEAIFYVATDGNDAWSGKLASPNRAATDGPFASLKRARDAVRELKRAQDGQLRQPVTVFVRGGTYFLDEPLVFNYQDSGTRDCPVVFAACEGESPVISGGRRVTGWEPTEVDGRKLWAAQIPEAGEGTHLFRQLWINGRRCVRARHPNKGYLEIAEVPDAAEGQPWKQGQRRFRFHEDDMQAWDTIADAEVVAMCRWVESHLPIGGVDEEQHMVNFGKQSVFSLSPGDQYYVEHALEALDAPGEWYLDRRSGTLYYMPRDDEAMPQAEAIVPVLSQLVLLEGTPQAGQFVEHLTLRGLTFSHAEWWFGMAHSGWSPRPDAWGFNQAAVGVPGAVHAQGARHCAFENCRFAHLGTYAVELARGCQLNRIANCEMLDLGAGGVKIGETVIRDSKSDHAHGNEVLGCHIHHGGIIFHSAIGVWIGQSYNNRVRDCHIHDFYYSGLSVGWTWGYGRTLARDNVIERNHVHHIGVLSDGDGPILSDMGGIYTLGIQPGTLVRSNVFHDIAGVRYGGWGIYFDEGSTHIVAENNIVYRTTHGGFHQHYGKENVVRNNIFAFGRDQQIQRSRPEPHSSFTFECNVVYWDRGVALAGDIGDFNFEFNRNLYWPAGDGELRFGELSFEQWQQKGMDTESIVADPLFEAPQEGDFRLKPNSPAFKLGFKPIQAKMTGSGR